MRRLQAAAAVALAIALQGCGVFGGGLFGGGTPPCENPQMYQDAAAADALIAPEGLETPQAIGNLEIPEGEVGTGQPRRSTGNCLEEPPEIDKPESG